MKRWYYSALLVPGTLLLLLTVVLVALAQTGSDSNPAAPLSSAGSDSLPTGAPEVIIPERYEPAGNGPLGGGTPTAVYFTPQDENTSTTVLFLYNTGGVAATVHLETYGLSGNPIIITDINVPAGELVRIAGDTVDTIAGSWQSAVLVNFTTSSTYAMLSLPENVKAEAYVAWNGGATYDPLDVVPTLPIRFSTDPPTMFLPVLENN